MRTPVRVALVATMAGSLPGRAVGAQAATPDSSHRLASTRPEARTAEGGGAVTTVIRVSNMSRDTLLVTPHIAVPVEWSVLLGALPFALAPGEGDTWLVSVRVPARALAGRYSIAVSAMDATRRTLMQDSLIVTIRPRRAVEVNPTERPPYAVSGRQYRAAFLVRNTGNVAATYALHATSALGGGLDAPQSIALDAGQSAVIHVAATALLEGQGARDDVLELRATDMADTAAAAVASAGVTVVQRAGTTERPHTIASTLRLRASDAAGGASPFELTGGGSLRDGGSEELEFVMRAKPGDASPFGEREEYRAGLRGRQYRIQAGDAIYFASPLSNSGQRGAGAGLELDGAWMGGGAYAQNFRFQPEGGTEQGAYVHLGGPSGATSRLGLSTVNRQGGELAGKIIGASATLRPMGNSVLDLEYAGSRGTAGRGAAHSARFSGGDAVRVDVAHLAVDPTFAGVSRGARYDVLHVNTRSWRALALNGSAATGRNADSLARYVYDFSTGLLELSYANHYSLAYSAYARRATGGLLYAEAQRGLVARVDHGVGRAQVWGTAETGFRRNVLGESTNAFRQLSIGGSAPIGAHSLSLFAETSEGASITQTANRLLALGFDAQMLLATTTTLSVGSTTRIVRSEARTTQMDARLAHALRNGSTVAMRVRVGGQGLPGSPSGQRLAYIEYSMPLALPIGPSRAPGRARGRVVDRQTGLGVANTLVRLGPQAAVTDADGSVAFAGLPAGAYRLTIAQALASGPTIFSGDPNVTVDSGRREPAVFRVAVEPAGTISGRVRRMVVARTGIGAPDSLFDAGPLEGVSIALVGARDTTYRSTDAAGIFHFSDVPAGAWTLIMMTDAGSQMQWEVERISVVKRVGDTPTVVFRLIPKRKPIRLVSGDGIEERTTDP